jgi:hypothetical protein
MARTNLTKSTLAGPLPATLPVAANGLDLTFTAADVANKNQFAGAGDDLLLAWNSGVSAYTTTFTSVAINGRTGDVTTYSIDAGEIAAFRFKDIGWKQSDGKIYVEASNAAVKFAVIAL